MSPREVFDEMVAVAERTHRVFERTDVPTRTVGFVVGRPGVTRMGVNTSCHWLNEDTYLVFPGVDVAGIFSVCDRGVAVVLYTAPYLVKLV